MTDSIYNDEAIIRSVTYSTRGGHKVSFELDPEGWERLKGMETTRCMMVLVPIQNDGQPDPDVKPTEKPYPDESDLKKWGKVTALADKPRRRMAELSRAQQAGILCNDERFQQFLERIYGVSLSGYDDPVTVAAQFVRAYCKVTSRAKFDSEPDRGKVWDHLHSEFDAWTGKIGWPEPARAGE